MVERRITTGNLWSILATGATGLTMLVATVLAYGDLKASDQKHELRLDRLEQESGRTRSDHDLLIEIRQDLKLLRQSLGVQQRGDSSQRSAE